MIGSMNRVILFVNDVPKCTAFYRDVLGLQQTGYADEGWVPFDAGGCLLTLHKATPGKRPSEGTRSVQIVFKVSDVAAARESLIAKGVDMGKLRVVDASLTLVPMRLRCVSPPPDEHDGHITEFGLQDKKQSLHPGERHMDSSIRYDFTATVERKSGQSAPRFGGPFVHGTPDAPFLYLGYREAQAGAAWIKRIKIPLSQITWAQAEAASAPGKLLEGMVSGQGAATVKLLGEGWAVRDAGEES
jgi:predicted enzyme related to lactoylglutathione lyase